MTVFHLPDLGEGLAEAEILEWRVAVGDVVGVDQIVVEVETAKAAVEVPIPVAGTVAKLHGAPRSVVAVGQPLISVTVPGEPHPEQERAGSGNVLIGYGTGATPRRRRRAARATHEASPVEATGVPRVLSPLVRRLAATHAIDLRSLTPTGPGEVILRRDVEAAIAATTEPPGAPGNDAPVRIPLRGVRRAIADKLARSRREIPDATTWVDVDATALVQLKNDLAESCPEAGIGFLALLARICVAGLRRYPELNSYVDVEREEIVRLPQIHLGYAAQTDRGLVVPVIHDAHALTLAELADRLRARTEEARQGKLTPQNLSGGTFTLNNYGVFGVDGSTPIINHPEAALLGVGRIIDRPWAVGGEIRLRKITQLSLTFDHRVCDGGAAGGFLRFVADRVERPQTLLAHL